MADDQPLYYVTQGHIYGKCTCEPKHQTIEEAKQCIEEHKNKPHGDKESRYFSGVRKVIRNRWLGHGDYEIAGSGANSTLYTRSYILDSICDLRRHVLVELEKNCFKEFASLYPEIREFIKNAFLVESKRQSLLEYISQEELESQLQQCKNFYNKPDLTLIEVLQDYFGAKMRGQAPFWDFKLPDKKREVTKEEQFLEGMSTSKIIESAFVPLNIAEDNLYYWKYLGLAATVYYKDNISLLRTYHNLKDWATKWKIIDIGEWLLDQAIETLILWWQNPKAKERLIWHGYTYPYTNILDAKNIVFSLEDVGWYPTKQSEANFTYHIKQKFNKYLAQYIQSIHILAKDRGLQKVPKLRKTTPEDHFKWFVKHIIPNEQGCTLSYEEIAQQEQEQKPLKRSTIAKGVDNANRLLLGLTLEND